MQHKGKLLEPIGCQTPCQVQQPNVKPQALMLTTVENGSEHCFSSKALIICSCSNVNFKRLHQPSASMIALCTLRFLRAAPLLQTLTSFHATIPCRSGGNGGGGGGGGSRSGGGGGGGGQSLEVVEQAKEGPAFGEEGDGEEELEVVLGEVAE